MTGFVETAAEEALTEVEMIEVEGGFLEVDEHKALNPEAS